MNLRLRTACAAAALAFASAALVAAQPTVVVTVGLSSPCQFDNLQEAIDFVSAIPAARRVLEVENRTFVENFSLTIATEQIEIVGGFESCGDPEPGVLRTRLVGMRLDRVLTIQPGPSPRSHVRLANLSIERGSDDFGGGVRITGPVDVVLENTRVFDNAANRGGGVFLGDSVPGPSGGAAAPAAGGAGPTLAVLAGSGVNGNRAVTGDGQPRGGGIDCDGGGRVTGGQGGGVVGNETADRGSGGGIHLAQCELSLTGPFTVSGNRANSGAGIFGFQSLVELRGTAAGPVRVTNNVAFADTRFDGGGGGIVVRGNQAELIAENARIDNNRAQPEQGGGHSGGVAVQQGAKATLDRTLGHDCPGGGACSSLSGNHAGVGAAARVTQGGRLEIRRTAVHDNAAVASVLHTESGPAFGVTSTRVEGSTLTANSGESLFEIVGDSDLEIVFSSVAGNFGLGRVVGGTAQGGAGEVDLISSILYEMSPGTELLALDPGIEHQAFCLVVPEDELLPTGPLFPSEVATTDDPQFVDLGQGDLHLAPTSPALDVCAGPAVVTDLDLDLRGHDLPEVPDRFPGGAFVFDAGADEIGPPGPIFSDGFESGDVSAWSGTSPTP